MKLLPDVQRMFFPLCVRQGLSMKPNKASITYHYRSRNVQPFWATIQFKEWVLH